MVKESGHDLSTVHGRLQFAQAKRGVEEKHIVKGTGLTQSTVHAALNGLRKNPQISTLLPIAEFLKVNILWVMAQIGDPFSAPERDAAIEAVEAALKAAGIASGTSQWYAAMTIASQLLERKFPAGSPGGRSRR